ncbi:hypothetical protein GCM10017655_38960 [Pseudomonas turukhanskensis]|uniref:Uncharacterized protein n=1 Tax=Pseudomonas turukhanskensis TaxID=1806536 RepID=A0A9W6K8F2_9PSED|nr:hypothetical protein GCM10017655_38960 [Pseudomonas turukhanskensis]
MLHLGEQGAQVVDLLEHGAGVGGKLGAAGVDLGGKDGHGALLGMRFFSPLPRVGEGPGVRASHSQIVRAATLTLALSQRERGPIRV